MKLLLALSIVSLSFLSVDWQTDFNKAKEEASKENKAILINFSGSDWCGPCIRFKKEIFESNAFSDYASGNLILVRADFPRDKKNQLSKEQTAKNDALAEKYNPEGKFPLTVLVSADGKVLKEWEGLPKKTSDEFVDEIKSVLDDSNESNSN
jgi:thioredoxin-related protein